ncbi:ATP-binding protein [Acidithiobacillus caldus]|nr:ATP-binding protein [Acidithiobacillus caldus]
MRKSKQPENPFSPRSPGDRMGKDLLARWGFDPKNVEILPEHHPQYRECKRHGRYPISLVDEQGVIRYRTPVCPVCAAEQASRRLMEGAAIPKRFLNCSFDNYVVECEGQQTALMVCRDYALHFADRYRRGSCLILCGLPGTGKNHLATAIAQAVLFQGYSVLQITAHDLIARIRQTWQREEGRRGEREVIREFATVGLLILDEVGKTFGGDGERVHLFEVIDNRYREMKPTLILSNESVERIEQFLGAAAFDRLCQDGEVLFFDWESHRRGRSTRAS